MEIEPKLKTSSQNGTFTEYSMIKPRSWPCHWNAPCYSLPSYEDPKLETGSMTKSRSSADIFGMEETKPTNSYGTLSRSDSEDP
jgi:hypothetical protein